MVQTEKQDRYCIISKEGGPVSISMKSDENIITGSEFRLFDIDRKTVKKTWKMSPENNGTEYKTLDITIEHLNRNTVVWQVLCCSTDAAVHRGTIQIKVMQDGKECKMTVPANYSLDNIPPCQLNVPEKFNGSLIFMCK